MCQIVLLWLQINGKTMKTLGFYDDANLRLDVSSLTEIQYLLIEKKWTGNTSHWKLLNMPYLYGFVRWTKCSRWAIGRLEKVTTSSQQAQIVVWTSIRRHHDVWKKTTDLQRFKDVWFMLSWKRPIYDVLRRVIYVVFKTSGLRRLEDVQFTSSWRRPIYDVFKMS